MSDNIQISPPLTLFTNPDILNRLDHNLLLQFLEFHRDSLTPEAAALLTKNADLDRLEYYRNWAAQFQQAEKFGAPLLHALIAIEALANPDNLPLLNAAAYHNLPPGWEINHRAPVLQRALSLWLLSKGAITIKFPTIPGVPEPPPEAPKRSIDSAITLATTDPAPPPTLDAPTLSPSHITDITAEPPASTPDAPDPAPAFLDHPCTSATLSSLHPPTLSPSDVTEPIAAVPRCPIIIATPETDAAAFAKLARLSPVEYDHVRRAEAKRLCLRLPVLDDAVEAARGVQADIEANEIHLSIVQPWDQPITDAPALFDHVRQRVLLYLSLVPGADIVLTLWPPHAHAIAAFNISPRLNFTSIEPGCGKSTALDLLNVLTPKVLRTDSLKTAVLFRVVDRHQPTLLLDELDTYLHLYPDLLGLLNAGNKLGASAHRCQGPHVRAFKAFAAIALAGLGHLPRTLRDRCIVIQMLKAEQGALQARLDERYLEPEKLLGRKIARWVHDNFAAIAACDPVMPPAAYNRLGDKWRPLFSIAQTIGGHWPQLITDAFHHLSEKRATHPADPRPSSAQHTDQVPVNAPPNGSSLDHHANKLSATPPALRHAQPDLRLLLLSDVCQLFAVAGADRLFSSYLVRELHALPARPWSGTHNGHKPITESTLARHLSSLGIHSKVLRIGCDRARGYLLSSLPGLPAAPAPQLLTPDFEI